MNASTPRHKIILRYLSLASGILVALTTFGLFYSQTLLTALLYYFELIAEQFTQGYTIKMSADTIKSESAILMTITTTNEIRTLGNKTLVPAGASTLVFAYSLNVLVPAVILLSLILAWPFRSLKEFIIIFLSAIIFILCILLFTVPFQLFGIYENQLKTMADGNQELYSYSLIHYWQVFCDAGGVWMLAIIGAIISITLGRWQTSIQQRTTKLSS
mgnify:CR=1 FL=1